jgi:putative transposase
VEELLFARGIDVTYEAIRQWCLKFGQDYANRLRRRRPQPGDKWYMDEVLLKSYETAKREILPGVEHRQHRYLNNRCENSHRPTRQRERRMQGFKSPGHAQRFLSAYSPIAQHFRPRRQLLSAADYRQEMKNRFECWAEMTGMERAALRARRIREGDPIA